MVEIDILRKLPGVSDEIGERDSSESTGDVSGNGSESTGDGSGKGSELTGDGSGDGSESTGDESENVLKADSEERSSNNTISPSFFDRASEYIAVTGEYGLGLFLGGAIALVTWYGTNNSWFNKLYENVSSENTKVEKNTAEVKLSFGKLEGKLNPHQTTISIGGNEYIVGDVLSILEGIAKKGVCSYSQNDLKSLLPQKELDEKYIGRINNLEKSFIGIGGKPCPNVFK